MPFSGGAYTRTKTFANGGTFLPSDLNLIQDDLGNKIVAVEAKIDKINFSPVTALPTTGLTVGQIVYYQSSGMAVDGGLKWAFQYTGSGSYPWDFVGGSPIQKKSAAIVSTTLGSASYVYQDLDSTPTLAVPLPGDYFIQWGVRIGIAVSGGGQMDVSVANAANSLITSEVSFGGPQSAVSSIFGTDRLNALTAGNLKLRCAGNSNASGGFQTSNRFINVYPIRCSA